MCRIHFWNEKIGLPCSFENSFHKTQFTSHLGVKNQTLFLPGSQNIEIREKCSILCSDFTLDVRVIKEWLIVTNFVCEGLNNVGCQNCLRLKMFVWKCVSLSSWIDQREMLWVLNTGLVSEASKSISELRFQHNLLIWRQLKWKCS